MTPLRQRFIEDMHLRVRLLQRLQRRRDEPESFAGLVQVTRFCGLLDESLAAHRRAKELDPAIGTSITNTHFLRQEYEAAIETYGGAYYPDAACWAALGDAGRAVHLLRQRLVGSPLSSLMSGLMTSLLAILEGQFENAAGIMARTQVVCEPEAVFYFARHFSMMGNGDEALKLLTRAQREGFSASKYVERDQAWSAVWRHPRFAEVLAEAKASESIAAQALKQAGGRELLQA